MYSSLSIIAIFSLSLSKIIDSYSAITILSYKANALSNTDSVNAPATTLIPLAINIPFPAIDTAHHAPAISPTGETPSEIANEIAVNAEAVNAAPTPNPKTTFSTILPAKLATIFLVPSGSSLYSIDMDTPYPITSQVFAKIVN